MEGWAANMLGCCGSLLPHALDPLLYITERAPSSPLLLRLHLHLLDKASQGGGVGHAKRAAGPRSCRRQPPPINLFIALCNGASSGAAAKYGMRASSIM